MVEALRQVEGEVALIGISNQGMFMPLVAAARPIKRITKAAGGDGPVRVAADPRSKTGRSLRFLTLVLGIACLADAALQTVLAITLSTGAFLVAKTAVHVAAIVGIMSGVLLYLRFRQQ